jgi:hypothetical protein
MSEDANGELGVLAAEPGSVLGSSGMEDRHDRLDCSTAGKGGTLYLGEVEIVAEGVLASGKSGTSKPSSAWFGCL